MKNSENILSYILVLSSNFHPTQLILRISNISFSKFLTEAEIYWKKMCQLQDKGFAI